MVFKYLLPFNCFNFYLLLTKITKNIKKILNLLEYKKNNKQYCTKPKLDK